ncbi:MAG: hypothetical protein IPJ94_11245 [Chloroflexi bacterium]|nr:hypothetical protein [Chloroflexota bacterium]
MNNAPFQVAINQKYRDKVKPGDGRFWRFNMTFQNTHLTLPKLLAAISEGYAWTAPHLHKRHHRPTPTNPHYRTTYRVKANVVGSQLLALDSDTGDERSQFDTLLADPFIGQYAGLLHASASSTTMPRTRIVFLLDQPLNGTPMSTRSERCSIAIPSATSRSTTPPSSSTGRRIAPII